MRIPSLLRGLTAGSRLGPGRLLVRVDLPIDLRGRRPLRALLPARRRKRRFPSRTSSAAGVNGPRSTPMVSRAIAWNMPSRATAPSDNRRRPAREPGRAVSFFRTGSSGHRSPSARSRRRRSSWSATRACRNRKRTATVATRAAQPTEQLVAAPGATCGVSCGKSWVQCAEGCKGGACQPGCDERYRSCMRACFLIETSAGRSSWRAGWNLDLFGGVGLTE